MSGRKRVGLAIAALAAVGVLVALPIIGWRLSQQTPGWWAPADPTLESVEAVGKTLETTVVNEAHELRPESNPTWTIRTDKGAINAWLATQAPKWIANQPSSLGGLARFHEANVDFTPDGRIRIGARLGAGGAPLAFTVYPSLTPEGKLVIYIEDAAIGRLPIPISGAISELRNTSGTTIEMDSAREPMLIDPVVSLGSGEGRRVRLIGFEIVDDQLSLTWRTERTP